MDSIENKPYFKRVDKCVEKKDASNVIYFKINEIQEPYIYSKDKFLEENTKILLKEYSTHELSKYILNASEFLRKCKIEGVDYIIFFRVKKQIINEADLKKIDKKAIIIYIPDHIWSQLIYKKDEIKTHCRNSYDFLKKEIIKDNKFINKLTQFFPVGYNHEDFVETFSKFINSLSWISMKIEEFDVYIVTPVSLSKSISCILFFIKNMNLGNKKINHLTKIGMSIIKDNLLDVNKEILDIISDYRGNLLHKNSIRNSVTSIMGRNMSHNIGSHVMARISTGGIDGWTTHHSVDTISEGLCDETKRRDIIVWSKDVQYLSRYIQQRMDFISQITTDWPSWTEPSYLMNDLMHWFLSQKHLLNHIAASEGLKAHLYPEKKKSITTINTNLDFQSLESKDKSINLKNKLKKEKKKDDEKQGDIRFHIFLVPSDRWENGNYTHIEKRKNSLKPSSDNKQVEKRIKCIINYAKECKNCSTCRSALLFTPSEGPAEGRLDEDILLAIPGGIVGYHAFYIILENIIRNGAKHGYTKGGHDHFDVAIEILYDPDEKIAIKKGDKKIPAFLFRIYDNTSEIDSNKTLLSESHPKGMNYILRTSIITETGELNKGNWGLAEMKIAAAFLQQRDISHIGDGKEKITGEIADDLKKLGEEDRGSEVIIRAVESPIGTLGYEFYIPKPRTVGIVRSCSNTMEVSNGQ